MNSTKIFFIIFLLLHTSVNQTMAPKIVECGKILALTTAASFIVNAVQEVTTAYICPEYMAHIACHNNPDRTGLFEDVYKKTKAHPLKKGIKDALKNTPIGTLLTVPFALVAQYGKKQYSAQDLFSTIAFAVPLIALFSVVNYIHYSRDELTPGRAKPLQNVADFHMKNLLPQKEQLGEKEYKKEHYEEQNSTTEIIHEENEETSFNATQLKVIDESIWPRVRLTYVLAKTHNATFYISACTALIAALRLNIKHLWNY